MSELKFAIAQPQNSVLIASRLLSCCHVLPLICGPLTQVLTTLVVLAKGSLAQASIQTLSQPFYGWMTKPALFAWRPGYP